MQDNRNWIKKLSHTGGFTLVELLVVLALLSILLGFFLQCFWFVMTQYQNRMVLLELESNIAIGMDYIVTDCSEGTAIVTCTGDGLHLYAGDNEVAYTLGTDNQADEHLYPLTGKILYRTENNQITRQPMANFISGFRVIYYDRTGSVTTVAEDVCAIDIQLEGQWNDTVVRKCRAIGLKDANYL